MRSRRVGGAAVGTGASWRAGHSGTAPPHSRTASVVALGVWLGIAIGSVLQLRSSLLAGRVYSVSQGIATPVNKPAEQGDASIERMETLLISREKVLVLR